MHIPKPVLFALALIAAVAAGWMLRVSTSVHHPASLTEGQAAAAEMPSGPRPDPSAWAQPSPWPQPAPAYPLVQPAPVDPMAQSAQAMQQMQVQQMQVPQTQWTQTQWTQPMPSGQQVPSMPRVARPASYGAPTPVVVDARPVLSVQPPSVALPRANYGSPAPAPVPPSVPYAPPYAVSPVDRYVAPEMSGDVSGSSVSAPAPTPGLTVSAQGNDIVIANQGSIVSVGDNTVLKANTGDAGASGAIGIDVTDSQLQSGDSSTGSRLVSEMPQATVLPGGGTTYPASRLMPGRFAVAPGQVGSLGSVQPPPRYMLVSPDGVARPVRPDIAAQFAQALAAQPPAARVPASRSIGIAGWEDHSIEVGGDDNLLTYDDSNLFMHRIGTLNGNTGDTDTSGLNVVDAQRSVVRSGPSGNSDESPDPPPLAVARPGVPSASAVLGARTANGAASVTDINGVSTATAQDSLVVGGDGMDDNGMRVLGNRNVATYDDGNVTVGGWGDVNSQIGDSDTSGTVAMAIRDSHVEAGGSFLPASQQAGAKPADPFDGDDPDVSAPGSPPRTSQLVTR